MDSCNAIQDVVFIWRGLSEDDVEALARILADTLTRFATVGVRQNDPMERHAR